MQKVSSILNNIKFDNKQNHFLEQIRKNAVSILNENEYFHFLGVREEFNLYIYRNSNECLESDFNLLFQFYRSSTGVVFYEYSTNSISLFVDASISTSYDEEIETIKRSINNKGWHISALENDIEDLIKNIRKKEALISDIYQSYSDDFLKSVFEEN